jgi:hypothetical protein
VKGQSDNEIAGIPQNVCRYTSNLLFHPPVFYLGGMMKSSTTEVFAS